MHLENVISLNTSWVISDNEDDGVIGYSGKVYISTKFESHRTHFVRSIYYIGSI